MRTCSFPVRSLGSALPAAPDASVLSSWIMSRYGRETDLITWHIETTLKDQLPAVEYPAAGGGFYADRLLDAFTNVRDGAIFREFDVDPAAIHADIELVNGLRKHCWWSLPAPSGLDVRDEYFGDTEECAASLSEAFGSVCRLMRDAGIAGHILTTDAPNEEELADLSGKKFLWAVPDPYLEMVLEYQRDVVVSREKTAQLSDLLDSYDIRRVYVCDPDADSLTTVLGSFDPEYIFVCGVGPKEERRSYWEHLAEITVRRDL
ncbi:hypothetical protein SDC9_25351 [bioreactor metagenome]|uniref:Uncharacterized protein n=1 Tax=bioreactor metagenome TaxID=1076179 RepID=A0A644UKU4_9ZZZZ